MEALSLKPSFFSPVPAAASAARAKPRRLSAAKTPPPPARQPQPNVPHPANFLRSVGGFLLSCLRGGLGGGGADDEALGAGLLRGGGIGMALMSSEAARRVSPCLRTLAGNPTFVAGLVAWVVAQSMKVLLNFVVERRWDPAMMFNSGGMPSSHSALCMALTSSVALCHGVGDALFPVCLGFSLIVMYDAIGVRRHAGMQAEVLNKIIEDLFQGHPISQRKLKELLGHTPSQVFAGAVLGILIACICCQGCFVAI